MPLGIIAEMEPRVNTGTIDARIVQPPSRRISTVGPSILKRDQNEPTITFTLDGVIEKDRTLAMPPRRGTIYIPPDDTTIPSMYMGIFSPVKEMEKVQNKADSETQVEVTGIAAELAKRRGRRNSLAAEPARRVGPMRSVLRTVKEQGSSSKINASQDVGRAGAATGKENLPPGFHQRDFAYDAKYSQDVKPSRSVASYAKPVQRRQTVFGASAPAPTKPQPEQRKAAWNSGVTMKAPKVVVPKPAYGVQEPCKGAKVSTAPPKAPSRFVLPQVHQQEQLSQHFPPLSEDIGNPAMYEENWLTHQEIAITQLLNNLFSSASSQEPVDPDLLRLELLDIYQSSKFVLLHKRLQGAILYGALRVPEDLLLHAMRLQNDLGVRRSFIDLWTKTYERVALKTALEVVVGRQCSSSLKDVRTFIEVFLIRNEDGCPDADCSDHAAWSYRRTILRSLMVIQLHDHAKTMANSLLTTSLFLATSQHKTSTEVLQTLIQLLNPSMGLRALFHLEYTVEHKQHPLEEYSYLETNLAISLRDGVRLTRLVELLLYPSASPQLAHDLPDDTVMTLNMPTGEILSMLDIESPKKSTRYPLSQHLKFPCEGRAVKLFNMQIALTALQQVKSMRSIASDISAEDLVDGFREKSVALLWGLTGKWGLGGLIDWKDVRSEISRIQRRKPHNQSDLLYEQEIEDLTHSHSFTGYKTLLKAWAGSVASSKGLKVNNLTTSFADGKVFEAIVDEYETYLPYKSASLLRKAQLDERLSKLGCSAQFCSLFAPSSGKNYQIFDCDFTLAALAFLCSRLLSASKRARAGIVMQRAWRRCQLRVVARRMSIARMLAKQCAEVVRTRERLVGAKGVIWGVWRMYKEKARKVSDTDIGDEHDHDDTKAGETDLWLDL